MGETLGVQHCMSRELQIKAMRYHHTPIRVATIQNTRHHKCSQGCEHNRNPCSLPGGMHMVWPLGRQLGSFL